MAPPVDPVPGDAGLLAATRVAIIGVYTAFFLARAGVPAVLCGKGHIAGEQSSRNWGWCRKMAPDPRDVALAIEAMRLWPEMNAWSRPRPASAAAASPVSAARGTKMPSARPGSARSASRSSLIRSC